MRKLIALTQGTKVIVSAVILGLFINTNLFAKNITYKVGSKKYEGYYLKNKNAPTVFIVHDWDGLTDYEKKRAEMLKKLGYSVFAADLFGKGIRPEKVEDKKRLTGELYKDRDKMKKLMNEAYNVAKKNGLNTKKIVAVGYCFGGTAILEWARSGKNLSGFASFHGGLETPQGQSYKNTKSKLAIFHGTADKFVSMDHFANLAKDLEKNNVPHEMITYSGAPHAFSVFGSERYRKDADQKSWARFVSFLKESF